MAAVGCEHEAWARGALGTTSGALVGVSERFSCKMGTLGSTGLIRVLFSFFLKFPKSFLSLFLPLHSRRATFGGFFFLAGLVCCTLALVWV